MGQPIDNIRRLMPGLDFAVAIRQTHERGRHAEALAALRETLALDSKSATEWYEALTDWRRPSASLSKETLTARGLAGWLGVSLDRLAQRIEENAKTHYGYVANATGPWGTPLMIAHEIRVAAKEVHGYAK